MFSLVMFDLDGTLIETMEGFADLAASLIERDLRMPWPEARQQYMRTSGIPFRQQLEVIFPGHELNDQVSAEFEQRKPDIFRAERMTDETVVTLQQLRAAGLRLVISSNAAQHFVDEFQQQESFKFDLALGYTDSCAKGRGHVDVVHQEFSASTERSLYVGDSINDGLLAYDCGLRFVAKLGTLNQTDFQRALPDAPTIDRVSQLKELITEWKS